MGPDLKTEIQIPDLWFDFYARFLPGTAFVGVARTFVFNHKTFPSLSESVILVFLGLLVSLLTQPLASRVVGWIESFAERNKGDMFVNNVVADLGSESRSAMIISKMHGEVTLYVQSALLSVLYYFLELVRPQPINRVGPWAFALSALCLMYSFEVAYRRVKRATQHRTLLDRKPALEVINLTPPVEQLNASSVKLVGGDGAPANKSLDASGGSASPN